MSRGKWIVVAVSSIVAVGNAQNSGDVSAAPSTPTTLYGSQGNVATNRALQDSELSRAADAARQKKALMAAMAAQSMAAAPRPTSAEAFLAANKPNWPTPPPSEPDITSASSPAFGERRERIAPTLPDPSRQPSAPVPQFEQKKQGLFERLRNRNPEESIDMQSVPESIPPSSYEVSSSTPPEPATMGPQETEARDAAMLDSVSAPEAVELPGRGQKTGFLGKLFGKDREADSAPEIAPAPEPQVDLPPEMVQTPAVTEERTDAPIPEPAPFETAAAETQPAPEPEPSAPVADIFSRRANAEMNTAETATIATEVQADIGGVLVTLYEGTTVGVISREGGTAKIRLKDQREGTVSTSALR